ncbi:MAG: NUDIX domain-containing protein [Fuerstiella sp.]|nr:NUDIX domain-containing protein [Fuerstiella sp.]
MNLFHSIEFVLSDPVQVAVGVVESAGHVLIGTRPEGVPLGGMTELPGGKCLSDETTRTCVVRECREETGLLVVPRSHLITTTQEYKHGVIELDFWRCGLSPDLPDLAEATDPFHWVPFNSLCVTDFPSGNAEALKLLKNTWGSSS